MELFYMFPGIVWLVGFVFLIIVTIMSLFIPIWVLRIKNEAIITNKLLREIANRGTKEESGALTKSLEGSSEFVKKCGNCHKMTSSKYERCAHCDAIVNPGGKT